LPKAFTAILVGMAPSYKWIINANLFRKPIGAGPVLGLSSGASLQAFLVDLGAEFYLHFYLKYSYLNNGIVLALV
jgi:ABC-type Fe3+-siderophore transport system permease subunit